MAMPGSFFGQLTFQPKKKAPMSEMRMTFTHNAASKAALEKQRKQNNVGGGDGAVKSKRSTFTSMSKMS